MSRLSAKARAQLPNTAFAYVNSKGQRRLPIHDEAHVRTALARFNQVKFEDDATRERARKKLLTAAKKYGIVPIGFITGQLATERLEGESRGRDAVPRNLPTGQVTFLLADIEDSTGVLRRVGDGYASLLGDVRRLLRRAVQRCGGKEVDVRADELFAVFKRPTGALEAAITIQRSLKSRGVAGRGQREGQDRPPHGPPHTDRERLRRSGRAHCRPHRRRRPRRPDRAFVRHRTSRRGIASRGSRPSPAWGSPSAGTARSRDALPTRGRRPTGELPASSYRHRVCRSAARAALKPTATTPASLGG